MDYTFGGQWPERPSTARDIRNAAGKPPVTGAWRDGDPPAFRQFVNLGPQTLEFGGELPNVRVAYESWGTLNDRRDNAILVLHALTGDAHVTGPVAPGQATPGWWDSLVGPGKAIDTDRYYVVCANTLGGCQGTTGPSSFAPDGREWGSRFPFMTLRDQVVTSRMFTDALGIDRWYAVIGGSMGGMQALEWGVSFPDRVDRLAVLAAPAQASADHLAFNTVQIQAITDDPEFHGGEYYDLPPGRGPATGLSLARRFSLTRYRSADEFNRRFGRKLQGPLSPLGEGGRFTIESYLDFHGNKFTRRFDANSYIRLLAALTSHDIGRGRGPLEEVVATITATTLVLGIDSDRLYELPDQHFIARHLRRSVSGPSAVEVHSEYGHDGFLLEHEQVGPHLTALLGSAPGR